MLLLNISRVSVVFMCHWENSVQAFKKSDRLSVATIECPFSSGASESEITYHLLIYSMHMYLVWLSGIY